MSSRRKAREVALQVLFMSDVSKVSISKAMTLYLSLDPTNHIDEFTRTLVLGMERELERIDASISEVSEHWRIDRMAPLDRNILRLGIYELTATDNPTRVVLNEAVELAKKFGTETSPSFVNGILDRIGRNLKKT